MKYPPALLFVLLSLVFGAAVSQAEEPVVPPAEPTRTITLADAQKIALAQNPSVSTIRERVRQADVNISKAWTMLAPSLDANASLIRNQYEIGFDMPNPSNPALMDEVLIQELWGKSFGLSANISLLNPRSVPLIQNAYDYEKRTRINAKIQRNDFLFAVTSAYYQALSMKSLIAVAEENFAINQKSYTLSEANLRAGQTTSIDVLRTETQLMDSQRDLDDAKAAYQLAKTTLANLLGIKDDFDVAETSRVGPIDGDVDTLTNSAYEDRLEFREARISKTIEERNKTDVWVQWLPKFDTTFSWDWNSAAGFADSNGVWRVIFGASWSLFDGARIADLKLANSEIKIADNNINQLELDVRKEVEQGFLEVENRHRRISLAEKQITLAEKNHEMTNKQYEVGIATGLDLLFAGNELTRRRVDLVLEQLKYDIAILTLSRTLGNYNHLADLSK
jgi:multidrug efflux system outer membrane protein